MNLNSVLERAAVAVPKEPGDYTKNGLLFCGQCHTAKQCRVDIPGGHGFVTSCLCACGVKARDSERERRRAQEQIDMVERTRTVGIANQLHRHARFSADDGKNCATQTVRRWADAWDQVRAKNIGLLLYGAPGTGKSWAAAAAANQLIDQGIGVFMTNLSSVMNALGGLDAESKNAFIENVVKHPLLILDDFGTERETSFALEQVFNVIDSRYRAGKPVIVTTNLGLNDLRNPVDTAHARIYSRVLEMCTPVNFGSQGRREGLAADKFAAAKEILKG